MIFNNKQSEITEFKKKPQSIYILSREIFLFVFVMTIGLFSPVLWASTVKTNIIHSQDRYQTDGTYPILFQLTISNSWCIHGPEDEGLGLIPTRLSFNNLKDVEIREIKFPSPEKVKFDYTSEAIDVYSNEILVKAMLRVNEKASLGEHEIKGGLSYQACSSKVCLPPETVSISITASIVTQETPITMLNQELFEAVKTENEDEIKFLESRLGAGFFLTLLGIFLGGLALNLTPCIYPLIPITVSYFGGRSEKLRTNSIFHGIFYLFGLAITNSILGVSAALSGGMLGSTLQHPVVLFFIAVIMVALAFSFFGFWELRAPTFLNRMAAKNYRGYFGTFFMGLTLGIIAAPCIGPFVLGLLTYVGQKGDPLLGFLYFFTLSIGMGLPLCILAVFSGTLDRLPRSGDWMIWVKRLMGWVLIGVAVYMVSPLIPYPVFKVSLFSTVIIIAGIQLGWLDKTGQGSRGFSYSKKILGIVIVIFGLVYFTSAFQHKEEILWEPYSQERISSAIREGKPIILDFYADWCLPCKELDSVVFQDPMVVQLSKNFFTLRLDLTKRHPLQDEILRQYNIRGVPTVLFFNRDGIEEKDQRIESVVDTSKFLNHMKMVLENSKSVPGT